MSRHYHLNNGGTNLTSNQIAGVTTTPINAVPSVTVPFYMALDATNINGKYEEVEVTSKTATNVNHAATTYAHTTAEEVRFPFVKTEADEFSAKLNGATAIPGVAGADGWQSVSDTWTYASASTITVPSGAASLYQKGDRIKCTNTTVKYFVVVGVADTVLTVAVNNDYVVANAAISSIYYSHQVSPIGYPTFFGYDPTWTGFSAAPTQDVLYSIEGTKCTLFFNGHSGTSNSATFNISAPVAPSLPGGATQDNLVAVTDNSSWQNGPGIIACQEGSTTLKVGKTVSTIAAGAYAGFTTSGAKGISGIISFRF